MARDRLADLQLLARTVYAWRCAVAPLRSVRSILTPPVAAAIRNLSRLFANIAPPVPPQPTVHRDPYLLDERFQADTIDKAAAHFGLPTASRDPDALFALAFVLALRTRKARAGAIFERTRAETSRGPGAQRVHDDRAAFALIDDLLRQHPRWGAPHAVEKAADTLGIIGKKPRAALLKRHQRRNAMKRRT